MKLIDKDALVAEIERRRDYYKRNPLLINAEYCIDEDNAILEFIDTLEVKEVDLDAEIMKYQREIYDRDTTVRDIAKHFFELGLKSQHSSISIPPNIDDLLEEDGIDPNSKDAKLFKECYYTALEKLKEKTV